eukprot:gene12611-biopygen10779
MVKRSGKPTERNLVCFSNAEGVIALVARRWLGTARQWRGGEVGRQESRREEKRREEKRREEKRREEKRREEKRREGKSREGKGTVESFNSSIFARGIEITSGVRGTFYSSSQ